MSWPVSIMNLIYVDMMRTTVQNPSNNGHRCEFCDREFKREHSLLVHVCEQSRRHRERDEVGVQMGFAAYLRFYQITQGSSRLRAWEDFRTSAYYRAFVRFGRHCQDIRAVNVPAFTDWLVHNNIKLDHWCHDPVYDRYLLDYIRREPAGDALARAIQCAQTWSERTQHAEHDYLRYGNHNTICHDITTARITGWAVYNCDSGREFLTQINSEQLAMIWNWIDADFWQRRFRDYPADTEYAREILITAGW